MYNLKNTYTLKGSFGSEVNVILNVTFDLQKTETIIVVNHMVGCFNQIYFTYAIITDCDK